MMISLFGDTLKSIPRVAFFIPLIPLMGGNVAVQSSTIVVRGLATGGLHRGAIANFVIRQLGVTLLLAVSCGTVAGAVAALLFASASLLLIVGVAVGLAVTVAGTLGMVLPFGFNLLGVDPAVSAGPFVTVLNDMFCIIIYLGLSTAFAAGPA